MYTPIKSAITAGGYTPVSLPTGHSCSSYSLWTEDGKAFYVAAATGTTGDGGIKVTTDGTAGLPLQVSENLSAGSVICYAKGTSSTNLVGIITKL